MKKQLLDLLTNDEGADLAEYCLLLGIITVAIASAITAFGAKIGTAITNATGSLP